MDFEFLEEKRKEQRYTVKLFCNYLGIDYSTYYRWKENPGSISVTKINAIVDLLKLSAKDRNRLIG